MNNLDYELYFHEWPAHIEASLSKLLGLKLQNSCASASAIQLLTQRVHRQVACYPQSPPVVLDVLAQMNDSSLMVLIAEHSQTSNATLSRLALSEDCEVRVAVAQNVNGSEELRQELAADACADVRYSMAENPAVTISLLKQLSDDVNPYVADRAARTLSRSNPATFPTSVALTWERRHPAGL